MTSSGSETANGTLLGRFRLQAPAGVRLVGGVNGVWGNDGCLL